MATMGLDVLAPLRDETVKTAGSDEMRQPSPSESQWPSASSIVSSSATSRSRQPPGYSSGSHTNHSSTEQTSRNNSQARSLASSSSSLPAANTHTVETVVIEEKRRHSNGTVSVHRYLRGRLLGKGGFAKVYLCTAMDTSKAYAVKIVPKANLTKTRAKQKLQAEIKIHRTMKHAHICEYKHFFEDRNNCYILLELCHNQSLNEMIKRRKRLTEPEAAFFLQQLLMAVQHMHRHSVIHRDLKLGNLFLDRHMNIKVGDFGLATFLTDPSEKRQTICGTPNYIAPEVIQGDRTTRGHSFEVDVWSMGVILFTLLVGKPPYEAKDVKATYQRILHNEYSIPPHLGLSAEACNLIRRLLQSRPSDRPTLEEIVASDFLNSTTIPVSLPTTCLSVSPVGGSLATSAMPVVNGKKSSGGPKKQPFGRHDPNSQAPTRLPPSATVKSLVSAAASSTNVKTSTRHVPPLRPATGFTVYDERLPTSGSKKDAVVESTPTDDDVEDDLVRRTQQALTLQPSRTPKAAVAPTSRTPASVASTKSSTASSTPLTDSNAKYHDDHAVLSQMVEQLEQVLSITKAHRGQYRPVSPRSAAVEVDVGPYVSRYVDYTSKYGLGFLLNNQSTGVYFNDSTKVVTAADSTVFDYWERRSAGETFSLEDYPSNLHKKVTLLKHFKNYLLEQQAQSQEEDEDADPSGAASSEPVYVHKWSRTKHAILFRLSNHSVQVIFHDQTEVLLNSSHMNVVTFVDKQRRRQSFPWTDQVVGGHAALEKRLEYVLEILQPLVTTAPTPR